MARTQEEILATMDAEQASQTELASLNSTSGTAIYSLWKNMIAYVQSLFESLVEEKKAEIEVLVSAPTAPTIFWIQKKAFEWQYDATTPQVIELIDGVPQYRIVDESLRILTIASVRLSTYSVTLTAAKNSPPEKLSAGELTALNGYFSAGGDGTTKGIGVGYAGQFMQCYTFDPDLVYIEAEISYTGVSEDSIRNDCFEIIQNYLYNLPISSTFRTIDLTDALQGVQGFVNIFITELAVRWDSVAFASRVKLIDADTTLLNEITVLAGYALQEDTVGETWTDKITFTAV